MKDKERNETKEFINKLLKDSKLTVQYFEIYYAEKIQQDMFEILTDDLETFNKLLSVSNEEEDNGFLGIKEFKNIYGFSSTEDCIVFYSQNNKSLDKIFEKPGNTLKDFIESIGLSTDLLTLTSRTSIKSKEENSETKKSIEIYNQGKAYESLSLERFNYSSNLKENLMSLIPLPNTLFYLIPFNQMESVKKLIDIGEKKIRDKLDYKTKYFGYNELDGIYMNDINSERKINNFEHYKIMKIFKINNKKIEKIKCEESVIRPYSINFIEVKSSFNNLEKKQQIIKFLEKCFSFSFLFEELKLNKLEEPKLYDANANKKDFPKIFCNDLFFIVDNNEKDFDKYSEQIEKQINQFLKNKNFTFNFQLFFSSKNFCINDLSAIHTSKTMDTNYLLLNYNKLNFFYEKRQKEYDERLRKYEEHLKKYEEEIQKENKEPLKKYDEEHLKENADLKKEIKDLKRIIYFIIILLVCVLILKK